MQQCKGAAWLDKQVGARGGHAGLACANVRPLLQPYEEPAPAHGLADKRDGRDVRVGALVLGLFSCCCAATSGVGRRRWVLAQSAACVGAGTTSVGTGAIVVVYHGRGSSSPRCVAAVDRRAE